MNVGSMLQMLLVMLPMLLIGTSLLTFLSAAAKSMKEAQSHMTWLMLLPMLPGYALVAYPLKSELWQYAVPFLSQNQMLLKVIRHETITPRSGRSTSAPASAWPPCCGSPPCAAPQRAPGHLRLTAKRGRRGLSRFCLSVPSLRGRPCLRITTGRQRLLHHPQEGSIPQRALPGAVVADCGQIGGRIHRAGIAHTPSPCCRRSRPTR
jgi:hypothetical protein